jgi:hypothetical protein
MSLLVSKQDGSKRRRRVPNAPSSSSPPHDVHPASMPRAATAHRWPSSSTAATDPHNQTIGRARCRRSAWRWRREGRTLSTALFKKSFHNRSRDCRGESSHSREWPRHGPPHDPQQDHQPCQNGQRPLEKDARKDALENRYICR